MLSAADVGLVAASLRVFAHVASKVVVAIALVDVGNCLPCYNLCRRNLVHRCLNVVQGVDT
jgi:hypothetical protein